MPMDPNAPYGRDPRSGLPYSDKSKVLAGVLQLFFPGVGRLITGHTTIGVIQLVGLFISIPLMCLGVGILTYVGIAVWAFVDAILILVGSVPDSHGRPLRP